MPLVPELTDILTTHKRAEWLLMGANQHELVAAALRQMATIITHEQEKKPVPISQKDPDMPPSRAYTLRISPRRAHNFSYPFNLGEDIDEARIRAVELWHRFNNEPYDKRAPAGLDAVSIYRVDAKGLDRFIDKWDGELWSSAKPRGTRR